MQRGVNVLAKSRAYSDERQGAELNCNMMYICQLMMKGRQGHDWLQYVLRWNTMVQKLAPFVCIKNRL
jgi:hypothetical protein